MERTKRWRADPRVWLSLLLVLAVLGVIFYFSAMPAKQSSGASGGFVTRLIRFFLPDFPSLSAERQRQIRRLVTVLVRKTAHVLEYAALGFSLRVHLGALGRHWPVRRLWLWAWLIGVICAAGDEVHQLFVPGRGPRLYDVGVDAVGVILGVLFYLLCRRILTRRRPKSENEAPSP